MENLSSLTKYLLLTELSSREMNGYELSARIEKLTGRRPSPSQVYPVLKQMKSRGYVAIRIKSAGRKKAKYYKLTASGRKLFDSMSRQFETLMQAALNERIKVCAHCGCEIIRGSYTKKIGGKPTDFCCESCASSFTA